MLVLAGWTLLNTAVAWAYIATFVAFEFWLLRALKAGGERPVAVAEAPYYFSPDEAELIRRYRFYFTYPGRAQAAASSTAPFCHYIDASWTISQSLPRGRNTRRVRPVAAGLPG